MDEQQWAEGGEQDAFWSSPAAIEELERTYPGADAEAAALREVVDEQRVTIEAQRLELGAQAARIEQLEAELRK